MQSGLFNATQQNKSSVYQKQIADLKQYRQQFTTMVQAQGQFTVSQQKVTSATERFNDAVRKNKAGISDLVRNFGILRQAQREQAALQNAMGSTWASSTPGKMNVDLFIPKGLTSGMNDLRQRYGYINSVISSIATQTVNWGKNTQWAGRQIMVGITVPLGIAAAGMAKLTYDMDKQLTRIAKVYDLQTASAVGGVNKQEAAEKELSSLRENSMNNAIMLANKYGQSVTDTLQLQANLAATGLSGSSLTKMTEEVSRIAALGELSVQQSTDMAIALKTAFRLTDEGVVHFDNYANAVENATSLSIQDIAEATPRAASALAGLGVSAEQMVVMLTAMREAGVDAGEGANALKSATTKLLLPSKKAVSIFKEYGINLKGIVNETQGNLFETLNKLGPAMEKMTSFQKQQAIAALFGTYQFNRLNAALANMSDSSTQAGKAMELMGKSEEELAAISAGELEKAANSASGKFKRYVEGIKGELAKMGQPILEAINPVLSGLNKLFQTFNKLGDGSKKFILVSAAILGVIGPILMLVGVFGNLIGSMLKGASVFSNLFLRFKMMTAEERAAAIAAKQATNIFDSQAMSAERLRASLATLTAQMQMMNRAQGGMSTTGAVGSAGGVVGQTSTTTMRRNSRGQVIYGAGSKNAEGGSIGGRIVSPAHRSQFEEGEKASGKIEQNAKKTSAHWGKIGGAVGVLSLGAVAMGSMAGDGQNLANNFLLAATAVSVISMVPWGSIADKIKTISAASTAGAAGQGTKVTNIFKGIIPLVKTIGGLLKTFWPLIAITAAVTVALELYKISQQTRKEWESIANSGQDFAELVGASGTIQTVDALTGKKQDSALDVRAKKVEELKNKNEDLYNSLRNLNNADLKNVAISEGFKVYFRGGDEKQIREAIQIALAAAGKKPYQIDKIMLAIDNINWENPESVNNAIAALYKDTIDEVQKKNRSTSFFNIFIDDDELTQGAAGAAKDMAATFSDQLMSTDFDNQGALLKGFNDSLEAGTKDTMARVNKIVTAEGGKAFGNGAELLSNLQKEMKKSGATANELNDVTYIRASDAAIRLKLNKQEISSLLEQQAIEKKVAQTIAEKNNWSDKEIAKSTSLEAIAKSLGVSMNDVAGANGDVASSAGKTTEELQAETDAAADLADTMRNDVLDAMKSAMSGTMGDIFSKADDLMEEQHSAYIDKIKSDGDAEIDRIEAGADKVNDKFEARKDALKNETDRLNDELKATQKQESKQFDKGWDQMMKDHDKAWDNRTKVEEDAYDARIKAIDDEIAAEEKAEDVRQKLFDAEISRIQRMSQMFNSNIDFNSALNSGNLDEAAKIQSSASATQMEWSVEDQRSNTTSALDVKKEKLNGQKDTLEKEKTDRMAALKEIQDAEKESLEARKDQEEELLNARQENAQKALETERDRLSKSLDAEKDAYGKSVSAQKDRAQKNVQAAQDASNKEYKARKEGLDQELAALKAYTPRNKAELDAHIIKVQAAYAKYGFDLKRQGDAWGQFVGSALASNVETARVGMADKQRWEELGNSITDGMAAAFDVTGDQLMQWLKSGIYPQRTTPIGGGKATAGKTGQTARHTGGSVGWSSKERTGVPRSASLYPSEYSTVLKKREFVVNEKASRKHGPLLNAINSGSYHEGGSVGGPITARHEGGFASIATGMMAAVGKAIAASVGESLTNELSQSAYGGIFGIAEAGKYGSSTLDAEQLKNASTIMNTGQNMGATGRDIMIALMTALQESSLRNLAGGDRDSVGLFQQRPSQGWGTVAQISNPEYAATKFFEGLFKVKGREGLTPTMAAQKVQRSAFPNAYAKWEDEATAIMAATPMMANAASQLTGAIGKGGRTVELLQQMMSASGLPYRITATTNGEHSANSYHYKGQAIDIAGPVPGVNTPEMAAISQFLSKNYGIGLAELIYGGPGGIGIKNGKAFNYSTSILNAHKNHVHAAATPESLKALGVPGLKVGGEIRYDNTLANLHKNEKVLTAPLSAKLDEGLENMVNGGNSYSFTLDLRGSTVKDDTVANVEKAVRKVIDERENRNGRSRVVA